MKKKYHPDTLAIHAGYNPKEHNNAIKPPIYQTSTFAFENASEGKAFFEANRKGEVADSFIYSRLDSPNLQIVEQKIAIWDEAEAGLVFESGMAAISSVFFAFLKPGDVVLHTSPLYGGTEVFFRQILQNWGIYLVNVDPNDNFESILQLINKFDIGSKISLIYIETPANPTNDLYDFEIFKSISNQLPQKPILVADNTYLGPVFQQPIRFGVDLVVYSATKYMGGHSDLIAGAVVGKKELINKVKSIRNSLGGMAGPHTAWLLNRSLETLVLRMEKAAENASILANWLSEQPQIKQVSYLGLENEATKAGKLIQKQCSGYGAMISFWINGGEAEAYRFLDNLKLIRLGVSLGSNESLAQHPFTMTHSSVPESVKLAQGVTPNLIRFSVGIEHFLDLQADLSQALESI